MTSHCFILLQKVSYVYKITYFDKNIHKNCYFIFYLNNSTIPIQNILFEKLYDMCSARRGGDATMYEVRRCILV